MRVLAIIPARGGSKGVPRKNILPIKGKPVIAYSIEAALHSTKITRTIVSTDDEEIAETAKKWGAEVPFMRPAELATDEASSVAVGLHALQTVEAAEGSQYDVILLLQPTTPLRTAADIDAALTELENTGADGVISVALTGPYHPYYMYTFEGERLKPFVEAVGRITRRQEFPPIYLRNGAIYAVKRHILVDQQSFFPVDCCAYEMPLQRSVNIDSPFDLELAEFLLSKL